MKAGLQSFGCRGRGGLAHRVESACNTFVGIHDRPCQPDHDDVAFRHFPVTDASHYAVAGFVAREPVHEDFFGGVNLDQIVLHTQLPLPHKKKAESSTNGAVATEIFRRSRISCSCAAPQLARSHFDVHSAESGSGHFPFVRRTTRERPASASNPPHQCADVGCNSMVMA